MYFLNLIVPIKEVLETCLQDSPTDPTILYTYKPMKMGWSWGYLVPFFLKKQGSEACPSHEPVNSKARRGSLLPSMRFQLHPPLSATELPEDRLKQNCSSYVTRGSRTQLASGQVTKTHHP